MKKTAILIYNQFCNFEFSVVLEILAIKGKPITIFSKNPEPVKSEEGLTVIADKTINDLKKDEYDSLILPGAMDIRETIEDEAILNFVRKFNDRQTVIGAISIAPVILLKAGLLNKKPFMAGVNQEDLLEEGFSEEDLSYMVGWNDNIKNPVEKGYIISDNIITSVSYNFVKWALGFGKMIGIYIDPRTFGL